MRMRVAATDEGGGGGWWVGGRTDGWADEHVDAASAAASGFAQRFALHA